jgi:hypothetical protein
MNDHASGIALAYASLRAAAHVGDFWVQTDCQAVRKGDPGWAGRLACGRHAGTYVGTQLLALVVAGVLAGHGWGLSGLTWGLTASGATHYWADRRKPLERLSDRVGKGEFYRRGEGLGRGSFHLDQAWHHGWEFIAALMIGAM